MCILLKAFDDVTAVLPMTVGKLSKKAGTKTGSDKMPKSTQKSETEIQPVTPGP